MPHIVVVAWGTVSSGIFATGSSTLSILVSTALTSGLSKAKTLAKACSLGLPGPALSNSLNMDEEF